MSHGQSNHQAGHNQSLDLVAALPGLRNWPEVVAFPERVIACELDGAAASRLAFRLKRKFDLKLLPHDVWAALSVSQSAAQPAPQIWPTGPMPGVYVTASQEAINALLERYEEATDGALVYAERAGNHCEGAIDLGDNGLWSAGLHRVPSGTLLIVGPLELNQQPPAARTALREAIAKRPFGLLLFGSEVIETHTAIELVAHTAPILHPKWYIKHPIR
jgi:hypothetical protein